MPFDFDRMMIAKLPDNTWNLILMKFGFESQEAAYEQAEECLEFIIKQKQLSQRTIFDEALDEAIIKLNKENKT